MNYKQFKECSLYQNFVYPRYISELPDFPFKPVFNADDETYLDGFIKIDKEDELWWQSSTFNFDGVIVPTFTPYESYISNDKTQKEYYINNLLDDTECFIHRSCGTWIGNTNTEERIKEKTSVDLVSNTDDHTRDLEDVTFADKKIWGFDPDKATLDDLSEGLIDGFTQKSYTVVVAKDSSENTIYLPIVEGVPLKESEVESIISQFKSSHDNHYPTTEDNLLLVSD